MNVYQEFHVTLGVCFYFIDENKLFQRAEGDDILNAEIPQNCSGSVKSVTLSKVDSKIAAEDKDNEKCKLIEEEKAETGRVSPSI